MHTVIIVIAILLALFLLYESGAIALQSKRAVFFTASINASKARFASCTGKITRIVRFQKSGEHEIRFRKFAQKGEISLSLHDMNGNALISRGDAQTYYVAADAGKRYRLCVQMEKATGNYSIEID